MNFFKDYIINAFKRYNQWLKKKWTTKPNLPHQSILIPFYNYLNVV
jgi:hypothetical protein